MVSMKTFKDKSEWLQHRQKIGGSDAGVILGLSKWRDNLTLWREKCGFSDPEDISDKPFVKYGVEAEPYIREIFRLHHPEWAIGYEENNMWTNDKYPFAHASLDGWIETQDGKYGILEIKTTEISSKANAAEWDGRIPDTYYCQLLHYLMVTGFDFAVLCGELKVHRADGSEEWRIVERRIDRAEVQADIDELEQKERAFWWHVEDKTEPGRLLLAI